MATAGVARGRHSSLLPFLLRGGPFASPLYQLDPTTIDILRAETRVLVVGAGGLGCEIVKNLALSYIHDIHLIDLDTIDLSNLNRQFLFRMRDINQSKAKIAAERIMEKYPHVSIQWHNKPLQTFAASFYQQFNVVIAGLDNIEARQWLNAMLVSLVKYDSEGNIDPDTIIPLIDGGTEGFGGQARVFIPRVTSCFECSLPSMPPPVGFPTCTIRNVPRIPEHCIVYALKVEWPLLIAFTSATDYQLYQKHSAEDEHVPDGIPLDKDNVEHMSWLYHRALARANKFGITGVTYNLTMQVVKNIIPAIASTNALIAAACVNECWKLRTNASLTLNNYFMFMGGQSTGTNCETFAYQRNPQCSVCQPPTVHSVSASSTLQSLIDQLTEKFSLDRPSVSLGGQSLYIQALHGDYVGQLQSSLDSLVASGNILTVHDKKGQSLQILIVLTE